MKILFDTRQYVLDQEVARLANTTAVFILEREGINDAGGVKAARSIAVKHVGSDLERYLVHHGLELTLPTYIRNYQSIVSQINPDLIVVADFFRLSSLQALYYQLRRPKTRLVLLCETKRWPTRLIPKIFMKAMLALWGLFAKRIHKIIVYTETGRNFFAAALPKVPVVVVPPSVDSGQFQPAAGKTFMPDGVLRLLMNARFVAYKRHALLIEVLRRLKEEGRKFTLTLIGRDGEGRQKIHELVEKAGLSDQVIFLSPLPYDQLNGLYNQHDLLVLPSYNEALGMVIPEAMAAGLGTVTSDTVGANVYVVPGATGLIFKTDDPTDLYRTILQCFDPERIQLMGKIAREHIMHHHSLLKKGDKLTKELV